MTVERDFLFDKYNTWNDWNLILSEKSLTPPEPKENLVELDGMSGSLDLSEALTGEITYKDRTLTATFWTDYGSHKDRARLLQDITRAIHGRKMQMVEPDTPDRYLYGRPRIKSQKNTMAYMEFSIEATCEPWLYYREMVNRAVTVSGSVDVVIRNYGLKTVCPEITITEPVTVTFDGVETKIETAGTYKISELKLRKVANIVNLSGGGVVTFTYREADL